MMLRRVSRVQRLRRKERERTGKKEKGKVRAGRKEEKGGREGGREGGISTIPKPVTQTIDRLKKKKRRSCKRVKALQQ